MQPTTSQAALAQLQQFQSTAKKPEQIYEESRQQYGVPQAQQTVSGLRDSISKTTNLLKNIAPGVYGRTGNSLVTSAQANRIIQNEQAPVQQNLSDLGGQYETASTDYRDLQQQAIQRAQLGYQGQQDQMSFFQNLYTTLAQQEAEAARLQEQKRQFDLAQQAARSGGGGGGGVSFGGGNFGGSPSPASAGGTDIKAKAQKDVNSMLGRRGTNSFYQELVAINKSAGYGNVYDRAKLELLKVAQPGLFVNGQLNMSRINALLGTSNAQANTGKGLGYPQSGMTFGAR